MRALHSILFCGLLAAAAAVAAQTYPNKAIRFIMPYPIGGSIDIAGRLVAQRLADNLGQGVVVDNRTGAGGVVGTETAAHAAPDGYTLLMGGTGTLALSPSLQKNLPYDPNRDLTPITLLVTIPYVVVVNPALHANNIRELIALAIAKPGAINYGSGGNGSAPHLAAELFKTMAGVKMIHIPYKGASPALIDVVAGHIEVYFGAMVSVLPHVRNGRLRPLGVTSMKRTAAAPEIQTLDEQGLKGFETGSWFGLALPAGAPREVVAKLHTEVVRIIKLPEVAERIASEGAEFIGNSPEEYTAFVKDEIAKWGRVVKLSGAKVD